MTSQLPVPQSEGSHSGPAKPPESRMSFLDHLGELRRRLMWAIGAVVLGAALCFHFAPEIFEFLCMPLRGLTAQKMIVLGPLEMFITYIKLALLSGLFLSTPFVLLQLWLFVAPGLYDNEKRWIFPFILVGTLFFVGGAAFCFYLVLPASFKYLIDMVPLTVEAHYSVSLYFSLIIQLMLAFGVIFELPLVMTLIGAAGVVTSQAFGKFRKYWIIIAFIIGGILTPTPDPLTQAMMAGPLIIFFEIGIMGARLCERRRAKAHPAK